MNLRKDHSHMIEHNSIDLFCMVCLGMLSRVPLADTNGRWAGHDALQTCPLPSFIFLHASLCRIFLICLLGSLQFSAMNVSVRATMKGAAKCDKHCELQISVSR